MNKTIVRKVLFGIAIFWAMVSAAILCGMLSGCAASAVCR